VDVKVDINQSGGPAPQPWTFTRAVSSPVFWKLSVAYGFAMMGVAGVMFQLAPRFPRLRLLPARRHVFHVIHRTGRRRGQVRVGALCDRFRPRRVVSTLMITAALGLALGLVQHSLLALALFTVIYGFSMGGVVSTIPIMIAEVFRPRSVCVDRAVLQRGDQFLFPILPLYGLELRTNRLLRRRVHLFTVLYLIAAKLIASIRMKVASS